MKGVTFTEDQSQPSILLDELRRCIRKNHHSIRTETGDVYWTRWYIRFHGLRHLMEMGDEGKSNDSFRVAAQLTAIGRLLPDNGPASRMENFTRLGTCYE